MGKSESVKINCFSFIFDKGGLIIRENGKDIDRFNPDHCIELLEFLSQHRDEFDKALKPSTSLSEN